MAIATRMTEQEYRESALTDEGHWYELWDGVPVEKPSKSMRHADVAAYLGIALANQLDRTTYRVNFHDGRARVSERNYLIPDLAVIPAAYKQPYDHDPGAINAFADPLPLVVEVWSPTTGQYDIAVKLRGYRGRGDEEIWYIYPYERMLTAWRKQPDGSSTEETHHSGGVPVHSLPGVTIDLDDLLNW